MLVEFKDNFGRIWIINTGQITAFYKDSNRILIKLSSGDTIDTGHQSLAIAVNDIFSRPAFIYRPSFEEVLED